MSRGRGAKTKLEGRISGYETADFVIVTTPDESQIKTHSKKQQNNFSDSKISYSTTTEKVQSHRNKKNIILFSLTIIILSVFAFIIHLASNNSEYDSYTTPTVTTPENAKYKPTDFTQKQLDIQYNQDKQIGELLKDGWNMSDNQEEDYSHDVKVGKVWEAIKGNPTPAVKITTEFSYDSKKQEYERKCMTIELQESTESAGITLDPATINVLKIYSSSINADVLNSSVQAAYSSTINSQPYKGSLTFNNDYVDINSAKNGRIINITLKLNTYIDEQ